MKFGLGPLSKSKVIEAWISDGLNPHNISCNSYEFLYTIYYLYGLIVGNSWGVIMFRSPFIRDGMSGFIYFSYFCSLGLYVLHRYTCI